MSEGKSFRDLAQLLQSAELNADAEAVADALWLGQFQAFSPPRTLVGQPPAEDTPPGEAHRAANSGKKNEPEKRDLDSPDPATKPGDDKDNQKKDRDNLYSGLPPGGETGRRASPFAVPAASALPGALDIARALRPFNRRMASPWRKALDEEATAESIAHFGFVRPVLRAVPERWFDVALVVDGSPSMDVWLRTIEEFEQLLARHGAFGRVRRWRLAGGTGIELEAPGGQKTTCSALTDSRGRTLIVIATNGVNQVWNSDAMAVVLAEWSRRAPVAILQLFSERQWAHTALGKPTRSVHAPQPGAAGVLFEVERKSWERVPPGSTQVALPMLSFAPESMARWARCAMAMGLEGAPAVVFTPGSFDDEEPASETEAGPGPDARTRVQRFAALASKDGFRLACYLAAVPLTLPVMRIVQQQMLERPRVEHLAEVIASGLLVRMTPADASVDPDMVVYDFPEDVRDVLLSALGMGSAFEVRAKVQAVLKEFVERQLNRTIENFRAFVLDEGGLYQLPDSARAFVEIERGLLRKFGFRNAETSGTVLGRLDGMIVELAFSSDGRRLAIASNTGKVSIRGTGGSGGSVDLELGATPFAIAWNPVRDLLAISTGREITLRSPTSGQEVGSLPHAGASTIVFSPNGEFLAGNGTSIRVWNMDFTLAGEYAIRGPQRLLAYAPDGRLAAPSETGSIALLDAQLLGGQTVDLQGRTAELIAFGPDGRFMAVAHDGNRISVLRLNAPSPFIELRGHRDVVYSLAFTNDGETLISGSADNTIRCWDVNDGRQLHSIDVPALTQVAFHAGPGLIAAGGKDGRVRILELPEPAQRAPILFGRARTPRRIFILEGPSVEAAHVAAAVRKGLSSAGHILLERRDDSAESVLLISTDPDDLRIANEMAQEHAIEVHALHIEGLQAGSLDFRFPSLWQAGFEQLLGILDELKLPGKLHGVPELPDYHFRREESLNSLLLWARSAEPHLSVIGPIGSGRRTLAMEFARTPEVRKMFSGGIYWMPQAFPVFEQPSLAITDGAEIPYAKDPRLRILEIGITGPRASQYLVRDLSDQEQEAFMRPFRLPDKLLQSALLRRTGQLAQWRRIVEVFGTDSVTHWLRQTDVSRDSGEVAAGFSLSCIVDLLKPESRKALRRLAILGDLPDAALQAVDGDAEALEKALRIAHRLGLTEADPRVLRPHFRARLNELRGRTAFFEALAQYYIGLRQASDDGTWGKVPDDGYFVAHIANILTEARSFKQRHDLLADPVWTDRRVAAHGEEALLTDAALAGLREEFEARLRHGRRWDVFVSYSQWDEGVPAFVEELAARGKHQLRFFLRRQSPEVTYRLDGEAADAIRQAAALLVVLSPSYLSSPQTNRELQVFLERQRQGGTQGFAIGFLWAPLSVRDLPEAFRHVRIAGLDGARISDDNHGTMLEKVFEAVSRAVETRPPLPALDRAFDINTPTFEAGAAGRSEWLIATAEGQGYCALLRDLGAEKDSQDLYWILLNSIRSGDESWAEFFRRVQSLQLPPPPAELPASWHEAMRAVAASLNDRIHASADAGAEIVQSASRDSMLLPLLRWNHPNTTVSRVAMYYAFLLAPDENMRPIVDAVQPDGEEVRYGRALLPWLRSLSWIASRMESSDVIEALQQKVDAVQMAIPGSMTSKGEFRNACEYQVHRRIRPWIALAALANDYIDTRASMPAGDARTVALSEIVRKMQTLADSVETGDLTRLLASAHAGRRLIAYGALTKQPQTGLLAETVHAAGEEEKPFTQYWGLRAVLAAVRTGAVIPSDQRAALEQLRLRMPPGADRAGLLHDILATRQSAAPALAGKRIVWVDDHPENNQATIAEFEAAGASVLAVTNTTALLALLAEGEFDLVISDIARRRTPDAGIAMVRQMREQGRSTPVVFHSGYLDEGRLKAAADLGVPILNEPGKLRDAVLGWKWPAASPVPERRPAGWVRVAGTGRVHGLPQPVQVGAELAGRAVAESGMGLITGGWAGVDHIAGREFAAVVERAGAPVAEFLLHMLDGAYQADLKMGRVESLEHGKGVPGSLERAQAVVLVGGEGGVWDVLRLALETGRPVIPLAGSGGDAARAWSLLRLAEGTGNLRSPELDLQNRDLAIRDGVAALMQDLKNPSDLSTGAGPAVVDLITRILPLTAEYFSATPMAQFEALAARIRQSLSAWKHMPAGLGETLTASENREWRLTGYLALQVYPAQAQAPLLMESIRLDEREMMEQRTTRPLYQWLNCISAAVSAGWFRDSSASPTKTLLRLQEILNKTPTVDAGGECKSYLRSLLSRLMAT